MQNVDVFFKVVQAVKGRSCGDFLWGVRLEKNLRPYATKHTVKKWTDFRPIINSNLNFR